MSLRDVRPATLSQNGSFKTVDGTIRVSKPYHSRTTKKLRALVTFEPRKSAFDISNEHSVSNEFRGFFTLFWTSIFIFTVQTYIRGIETIGRPLDLKFATLFSRHAIALAISDGVLVLSTTLAVPFAIALKKGWIRYYWTGVIIQHIYQTIILFSAVKWTFDRKWPWVQSGFLTLHSLVMIMKMHSYITVNGQHQYTSLRSAMVLDRLKKATWSVGGWEQAIADATPTKSDSDVSVERTASLSTPELTPLRTPDVSDDVTVTSVDMPTAIALRKRLAVITEQTNGNITTSFKNNNFSSSSGQNAPRAVESHPLVNHPDEYISSLAKELSELQNDLTSPGPQYIRWPNNISLRDYALYLLVPTLVYEMEYPRTDRIRPLYIFEKTVATFGTFALLYTVTERFIIPYTPTSDQPFLRSLIDLALPFMMCYLLLFYIIFECICNGFAELSLFADRQFYEDWVSSFVYSLWNSTSWDEFARKWNKPVHTFLLRHVYAPTLDREMSKTTAMFFTFLLSACLHELVMVVVTHKFRCAHFLHGIVQIPMIALSRIPAIKRNRLMGNIVFWLGLYAGFPLLCVAYVAY
ncbi:MBOAT, membrane-bound O-acyltransferase family-domain-containing protein [Amanita rubescens]|nr:MBOAT, membrane-bound O-acyltransferase family-domain-containing protein [Amanita rubescens]